MGHERMSQQIMTHAGGPLGGCAKFPFDFDDELECSIWTVHCYIDASYCMNLHSMNLHSMTELQLPEKFPNGFLSEPRSDFLPL